MMLLNILPGLPAKLDGITNTLIYSMFVDDLIKRDRNKGLRTSFSDADQLFFGQRVAWWLWLRGGDSTVEATQIGREVFGSSGGYRVAVGAAVKLARLSFPSYTDPDNGQIVDFGSTSKLTGDLGLLVNIPGNWTAGVTLRNLGAPEFQALDGVGGGSELPTMAQAGLAFKWNPESTVAFDYQQNRKGKGIFNLGGEIWFYDSFAIRAAITSADAGGGFSIKARHFKMEMAFLTSEPLGASYRLGLNVPLGTEE